MKKKITIKDILVLQIVIAIYTLSTVMAKQASGQSFFFQPAFLALWGRTSDSGYYALLWQQMIKNLNFP